MIIPTFIIHCLLFYKICTIYGLDFAIVDFSRDGQTFSY